MSYCFSRQKPQWYKRRRPPVAICENIRKILKLQKGQTCQQDVKQSDHFCETILMTWDFAKICVTGANLRGAWITFVTVWWLSRKWKRLYDFRENEIFSKLCPNKRNFAFSRKWIKAILCSQPNCTLSLIFLTAFTTWNASCGVWIISR